MTRVALALACLAPAAALGQSLALRPLSLDGAFRTMHELEDRPARPLGQTFVLPERPGQNQVSWYDFE